MFFSKAYCLEPGSGGAKPYVLLRKAMEDSGRVALARVTLRTRPTLALIRLSESGALLMETLFDPDEIRDAGAGVHWHRRAPGAREALQTTTPASVPSRAPSADARSAERPLPGGHGSPIAFRPPLDEGHYRPGQADPAPLVRPRGAKRPGRLGDVRRASEGERLGVNLRPSGIVMDDGDGQEVRCGRRPRPWIVA